MASVTDRPRELVVRSQTARPAGRCLSRSGTWASALIRETPRSVFEAFYTTKPNGMGDGAVDLPLYSRGPRRNDLGVAQ